MGPWQTWHAMAAACEHKCHATVPSAALFEIHFLVQVHGVHEPLPSVQLHGLASPGKARLGTSFGGQESTNSVAIFGALLDRAGAHVTRGA